MKFPIYTTLILALILLHTTNARAFVSKAWVADQYNGNYVNPIINADYSDPDVVEVNGEFYMTASSFSQSPGLPILHSTDLVNWELINNALPIVEPAEYYAVPRHGKGVWAPSIRYHDGEFYIYYGDPDFGVFMIKTTDPGGKWSKPVLVKEYKGIIDTTPLWDDDGRAYLVNGWAASRAGMNNVLTVTEMSPDGTQLIGNPAIVFDGNDGTNFTVEGPKFYKRNEYYYILAPAGGVAAGWQLAMRSSNPFGPYETKIVMSQGTTDINGPHQGGLVDTPDGKSWFIHFQDKGYLGRVVHLNPVEWINGWPVIGTDKNGDGCGEPVHSGPKPIKSETVMTPADSDDFDSPTLSPQWSWSANYQPIFGFPSANGFMRIYGHFLSPEFVNFWEVPNILTQRFPSDSFTATAKLTVHAQNDRQQSGLIIMGQDYARLSLEKHGDNFDLKLIICKNAGKGGTETTIPVCTLSALKTKLGSKTDFTHTIWLRVVVNDGICSFSYSNNNVRFTKLAETFKAREGRWIGARIGFFSAQPADCANRGWIDIDYFTIEP